MKKLGTIVAALCIPTIVYAKIKVGLIGLGAHMEENLIPSIKLTSELKITACSCRTLEKLDAKAAEYDCELKYTDWKKMIDDKKIDAVVVSGPPELHEEVAKYAITHGVHVFAEKPLTTSFEVSKLLAELAQANPEVVTSVGLNFVYGDNYQKVIKKYKDDIRFAKMTCMSSKPTQIWWDNKSVAESFLLGIGVHAISVIVDLYGEPQTVTPFLNKIGENTFSLTVHMGYDNGKNAVIEMGNYVNRFIYNLSLVTSHNETFDLDGFSKITFSSQQRATSLDKKEEVVFSPSPLSGGYDITGYRGEFINFAQSILTKQKARNSFETNFLTHKVIQKILESI